MGSILLPTDFSPNARKASLFGLRLAHKLGLPVQIVHVFHLDTTNAFQSQDDLNRMELDKHKATTEKLKSYVEEVLAESNQPELNALDVQIICDLGFPVEMLLNIIDNQQPEFVVMGTHGASGLKNKLLGSNTSHLIENSNCPVIALHQDAHLDLPKQVTLTADFRVLPDPALDLAKSYAKTLNMDLKGLHVDEKADFLEPHDLDVARQERINQLGFPGDIHKLEPAANLLDALSQTLTHQGVEMVMLSLNDKKLYNKLFHPSIFKMTSFHTNLPILVMPKQDTK